MTTKEKIYSLFLNKINEKINAFQVIIDDLRLSIMNETKSTAGDKHETALAMLQREQSQISKHLFDAIQERSILLRLPINTQNESIRHGSLVQTNRGLFFISVAMPKIIIDEIQVFGISPESPLGKGLIGKGPGEQITANGIIHTIEIIS